MGLARFELASRSPEPRRMDQATPQSRAGGGAHRAALFEPDRTEGRPFHDLPRSVCIRPPLIPDRALAVRCRTAGATPGRRPARSIAPLVDPRPAGGPDHVPSVPVGPAPMRQAGLPDPRKVRCVRQDLADPPGSTGVRRLLASGAVRGPFRMAEGVARPAGDPDAWRHVAPRHPRGVGGSHRGGGRRVPHDARTRARSGSTSTTRRGPTASSMTSRPWPWPATASRWRRRSGARRGAASRCRTTFPRTVPVRRSKRSGSTSGASTPGLTACRATPTPMPG